MRIIALASLKEALNKKIVYIIGLATLIYMIILVIITNLMFARMRELGADSTVIAADAVAVSSLLGFYFSSLIVALFTIMVSVPAVSSEIESGVIHSVITKPIRRRDYILGKYAGLAVLTGIYAALLYVFIVLMNIIMDLPPINNIGFLQFVQGMLLFILQTMAILSLCIFGSVIFRTISNGIIAISVFILGMIGGMIEQIGYVANLDGLVTGGIVISLLSPFDAIYRKMMNIIYENINISGMFANPMFLANTVPSSWMVVYTCIFTAGFLLMAVNKFNKRDIN